mmetsp:Transcript_10757/g.42014  ORF Transcript_10757/g.42014 Transcript_10757/m.42014 type:complete len:202 (+) Transcript_10757:2270-2875(+)
MPSSSTRLTPAGSSRTSSPNSRGSPSRLSSVPCSRRRSAWRSWRPSSPRPWASPSLTPRLRLRLPHSPARTSPPSSFKSSRPWRASWASTTPLARDSTGPCARPSSRLPSRGLPATSSPPPPRVLPSPSPTGLTPSRVSSRSLAPQRRRQIHSAFAAPRTVRFRLWWRPTPGATCARRWRRLRRSSRWSAAIRWWTNASST